MNATYVFSVRHGLCALSPLAGTSACWCISGGLKLASAHIAAHVHAHALADNVAPGLGTGTASACPRQVSPGACSLQIFIATGGYGEGIQSR